MVRPISLHLHARAINRHARVVLRRLEKDSLVQRRVKNFAVRALSEIYKMDGAAEPKLRSMSTGDARQLAGRLSGDRFDTAKNQRTGSLIVMDSELRAEIKRVFALDDAARAEYEDWQQRQEAKAQSRIIRKTYQTPPQPQRTAAMDDGLEERMRAFAVEIIGTLADVAGETTGRLEREIKKQREEIAALHADLALLQSIVRGDVRQLKGKVSDAA